MASGNTTPTPHRKTHAFFDLNTAFVTETAYSMGRTANAMFNGTGADFNGLEYTSGWGVRAYQENLDVLLERTEASSSNLLGSNGKLVLAPGLSEVPLWRPPSSSELIGATIGASSNLATPSGIIGIRKSITAGVDLSTCNLAADQSAFPPPGNNNPYNLDPTIALDRVLRTVDNDSPETSVLLCLINFGGSHNNPGLPARFYFCGPAGENQDGVGTGQYCVEFPTLGQAVVSELCDVGWVHRLRLSTHHKFNNNNLFFLRIYKSKVCKGPNDGSGGWIKFDFSAVPHERGGNSFIDSLTEAAEMQIAHGNTQRYHYRVPGDGTAPTSVCPLRLDLRRDLSTEIYLSWFQYPTNSILVNDSDFESIDFFTDSKPILFTYNSCEPDGTTCTATLHRSDTGAELTVSSTLSHGKYYTPPTDTKRFFVQWTIQALSTITPIIQAWNMTRDAVTSFPGQPLFEIGDSSHPKSEVRSVDIRGAERDLSHAGVELTVTDPLDTLTTFKLRTSMPMRVSTEYDPLDDTNLVSIHRGFADRITGTRKKSAEKTKTLPKTGWNSYHVKGKGIWQVLEENFIDTPILSLIDQLDGLPFKAVDFIHRIISNCGFDYVTDFDFPTDDDTRLFASSLDFTQTIDMLDKSSEVVQSLARDFIDRILVHDDNVGSNGKWRLLDIPIFPYTPVAGFTLNPPTGGPKLVHHGPSYSGGAFPVFPINGEKDFCAYTKPPEANWIFVASIGAWDTTSPTIYCPAPLVNTASYDYLGQPTSDPNSPDYLGRRIPVYIIDTSLMSGGDLLNESKNAVNALARRAYNLLSHGIKMLNFNAQLGFIVHESDATKVRPLRHMDPVDVDGTTWLIRNVNPSYVKDGIQYADFELEAPRI